MRCTCNHRRPGVMVATSLSTREVTMAHVVTRGQVTGPRRLGLLPAEATSFVGRDDELAGIAALLGTARLVTVVGPAGSGQDPAQPCAPRRTRPAGSRTASGSSTWARSATPAWSAGAVAAALGVAGGGDRATLAGRPRPPARQGAAAHPGHVRAPGRRLRARSPTPCCAPLQGSPCSPPAGSRSTRRASTPSRCCRCPPRATAVDLFAQRAAAVLPGFTRHAARTGRTSCGCAGGSTASRSRSSSPPCGCARCRCRSWQASWSPASGR